MGGHPRNAESKSYHWRTHLSLMRRVKAYADKEGISINQAITLLVTETLIRKEVKSPQSEEEGGRC